MNHDEEDWKKQLDKLKVVQKCPKCGKLALKYENGKIKCSECGYGENVPEVK